MKIKMKPLHIFLSLLGVLVICSLFTSSSENFDANSSLVDFVEETSNNNVMNPGILQAPSARINPNFDSGIPEAQIPPGDKDLYILKSEIVPPVCPKCPTYEGCSKNKQCQPCPPCARCPEPAFDCKKVPNYNPTNEWLPGVGMSQFSNLKTF